MGFDCQSLHFRQSVTQSVAQSVSQSINPVNQSAIAEVVHELAWYRVHVQVPARMHLVWSACSVQSRTVWLYRIEAFSSFLLRSSCLLCRPSTSTALASCCNSQTLECGTTFISSQPHVCASAACAVILHHLLLFI